MYRSASGTPLARHTPNPSILPTPRIAPLLCAACLSAALSANAQAPAREFGGFVHGVDLGGFISFLSGEPGLRWQHEQGTEVTAIPNQGGNIDVPGGVVSFSGGRFLISGKDSRSGHGWMVRLQLVAGPPRTFSQIETVDFGDTFDPCRLYWNEGENRLYMHDWDGQRVLYTGYTGWGPIPRAWNQAANSLSCEALATPNTTLVLHAPPEPGPGFVLVDKIRIGDSSEGPFLIREAPTGGWTVDDLRLVPHAVPDVWGVADRDFVAANGPIRVSGAVGPFVIVDAADDTVVASGSLSAAHTYENVHLGPAGLVPGKTYLIRDGNSQGFLPSRTFVPFLRYGTITTHAGYEPTRVRLRADDLVVGRDAKPRTHVHWRGTGTAPTTPFDAFLWVGIDQPGATVDLNGSTVLADPILSIGPRTGSFWNEHLAWRSITSDVPIPDVPGVTLLFQFVIALPDGEVIVTDIAGAEVRGLGPASSSAARSSGGGSTDPREAARRLRLAAPPEYSGTISRATIRELVRRLAER